MYRVYRYSCVRVSASDLRPRLAESSEDPAANGTGSADAFRALAPLVESSIFAVAHPHLRPDASSRGGLDAMSIHEITADWAELIVGQAKECSPSGAYVLIGASLGGLFAHLVGVSPLYIVIEPLQSCPTFRIFPDSHIRQ